MTKSRKLMLLMLVVMLAAFPSSGCYDRIELEGMAFVVALGLDQGPDNTIDVTIRIAMPSDVAGGAGGGEGSNKKTGGSESITVRAHTLPEALSLMNGSVERRISMIHLANVYVGEELARQGVLQFLRPITRMREFRRTIRLFVVQGSARELFLLNEPVLERSITRFQESLVEVGRNTGYTAIRNLHEFLTAMETKTADPIAPVVGLNREAQQRGQTDMKNGDQGGVSQTPFKEVTKDTNISFRPGEVIRAGGNSTEIMGTAVFRNDRLVAFIDGIETRMLLSIRGELTRTQMSFDDPLEKGTYTTLELKHARGPRVTVDIQSTPMTVKVEERLEGDLFGVSGNVDYSEPKNMRLLEQHVRKRLKAVQERLIGEIFHKYQADPFDILNQTRVQFATSQEMNQADLRKKLRDAKVEVDVRLNLRRIGTQFEPIESN